MGGRRPTKSGQALTELALITPIALLLVLGTFDVSIMATDTALAVSAVRHGARLAAELGGNSNIPATCNGTLPAATTLAAIDGPIVQTVLTVARNSMFVGGLPGKAPVGLPEEIDIYRPSAANGVLNLATDHYQKYVFNDNFVSPVAGTTGYPLNERCQGPQGMEADIGVRMIWSYRPANGIPGPSMRMVQYATEKLSLCSDNCTPA